MGQFEEFWKAYPKRKGANPKAPAEVKFLKWVAAGVHPLDIIDGAMAYARSSMDIIGTPYVAQAITWLNQRRWEDYESNGKKIDDVRIMGRQFIEVDSPEWKELSKLRHWPQTDHKIDGCVKRGWFFEVEKILNAK